MNLGFLKCKDARSPTFFVAAQLTFFAIPELFVDADAGPVFFETRFDFFCVKGPLKTENESEIHNSF